jgi:WD40 repeat protein
MTQHIDLNSALKILDLKPGVSQEEIKQAYRNLAKQWHPDRFLEPAQKQGAEEKIKIINQAYEQLKNYQYIDTNTSSNKTNVSSQASTPEIIYQRGMSKAAKGQYNEAIEDFTIAIRLKPDYIEAYKFRALACEKLGYINRAKSDYKKAIELKAIHSELKVQNPQTASPKQSYQCKLVKSVNHGSSIWRLAVSTDGKFIASVGSDNTIKIWRFPTGNLINSFTHDKPVRCLALSNDNQMLAGGGDDGSIYVWQVATGKLINKFKVHSAPVCSVIVSPDNQTIISSGNDTSIKISHISMGEMLHVVKAHAHTVNSLVLSSDRQTLISCSSDKTIKRWNSKNLKPVSVISHSAPVTCIAISPRGCFIASGGFDQSIILWDINTGKKIYNFAGHRALISSVCFTNDSQMIASTSTDGALKLWQISTGEEFHVTSSKINLAKFSEASNSLFCATSNGVIEVWQCN